MKSLLALLLILPALAFGQVKISELPALGAAPDTGDKLIVLDISAGATKAITITNLFTGPTISAPVLSGTVTGTFTIGGTPTFPSGVTLDTEWDTIAEIETALGSVNLLLETEIDASSELLALMDDETGTGALMFGTSPTFTTSLIGGTDAFITLDEHATSAGTAGAGTVRLYAKADGLLYSKDDAGTETLVSGGAGGAATNLNDIGDATADGSVAQAGFELDITSTLDSAGKAIWTITNTDADTAADTSFIDLRHNDGGDANVFYARFIGDNDGTPVNDFLFSETAFSIGSAITTTFNGPVTMTGNVLTTGTVDLGNTTDTTLSRSAAGILAVEGVDVLSTSSTHTLTNKTYDTGGTGNVFKAKGYIYLTHPHLADGTGATLGTTATSTAYGHATFSNSADKAANYVEYYLQVPEDIDTSVALRGRLKVLLSGGADTNDQNWLISSVSVADSAVLTSSTLANEIALDYTADASGASGDIETTAWTTLTSWAGALTAGQTWRIRLMRDGDTSDASTVNSTELGLVIEYAISQ